MPIRPGPVERMALGGLNLGPGPVLDLMGALGYRAVAAAVELGLFEGLAEGPATSAEAAARLRVSEGGVAALLEALEPLGYVARRGPRYANSSMTTKWMLRSSKQNYAGLFAYFGRMLARWENLEESIRRGRPAVEGRDWFDSHPGEWREYHAANRCVAGVMADSVTASVELPTTARRLVDIGGGHGLHSVALCRKYPSLSATVVDWGTAREVAEETIAEHGMQGRVSFREADLFDGDLGEGYDAALLFNVVHIFAPERTEQLLRKAMGALAPGGVVLIFDLFSDLATPRLARTNLRLLMLELFNGTAGQTDYGVGDLVEMVERCGFSRPRVKRLRRTPGFALASATRTDSPLSSTGQDCASQSAR